MLICWGVSHRTTAIAEREAAAHAARALWQARPTELAGAGLVPLLTCNRVELYADVSASIDLDALRFAMEHDAYSFEGDDAVRHLARVACGLDSVVLGETQIIAQVADALRAASQAGTVTRPLRAAFRTALRTAERARSVAWSAEPPASIGSAAVHVAIDHLASAAPPPASEGGGHLLIVGAGHVARAVAAELLRLRGRHPPPIRRVTVLNRSLERAERVARILGAEIGSLDALPHVLRAADVVIAATASPTPVIRAEDLRTSTRPVVVIDAGMPRNVEPDAGSISLVTLLTVDSLVARNSELQTAREQLAGVVEDLVAEAIPAATACV